MREFTVAEIAELLDVNEETVRRWRIRGRNGVQLAVPSAGDRPGRKGYRITSGAVRHFLAMNPSLMTVAMQEALAQDGASPQTATSAVPQAGATPAAGAAAIGAGVGTALGMTALPALGMASPLLGAAAAGLSFLGARRHSAQAAPQGVDGPESGASEAAEPDAQVHPREAREQAVMRSLLEEKLAVRAELEERLRAVNEEIDVLAAYSGLSADASPDAPADGVSL